jgi:archaetidylinositol phosphate synthase
VTLDRLRPLAELVLDPMVATADRIGLTPDGISVLAFAFAVAAAVGFYLATPVGYVLGAACVLANGWLDLLDGALARTQNADSRGGDLLDHVLDRYADIVLVVGLAAGIERYDLGLLAVTGVLMTSYLGTQIQAVGLGREYGGLVGRADRLALVGLGALVAAVVGGSVGPLSLSVVGYLLAFFALIGHFTALQRFWGAWSDLS